MLCVPEQACLWQVCGFGFEEIATLLLENTADPNIANQKHATPLTKVTLIKKSGNVYN